ncbi:MAG TPA: ATP-binding protein [Symbiobacteriaceae bacterium]|jgi:two-component system sensor histidine kinase ResE
MNVGIATRLWLTITVLTVSVLLLLGITASDQIEKLYDFHLSQHMLAQAKGMIEQYAPDPEAPPKDQNWERVEYVLGVRTVLLTSADLAALTEERAEDILLPPTMARSLLAGGTVSFRMPDDPVPAAQHRFLHGAAAGYPAEVFVVGVPLVRSDNVRGALLLYSPETSVAKTVDHFRQTIINTAAVAVAVVTLLALFLSRRLSNPLKEMDVMARAMAAGDFQKRVKVSGHDEIGRLGESINRLAGALADTIEQLADKTARLSGILTSMGDAVIHADASGQVTILNPPALSLVRSAGLDSEAAPCSAGWDCLERLGIGLSTRRVLSESRPEQQRVQVGNAVYAVQLAPVQGGRGQARSAVIVWKDITQEERLEGMRRDFVANVSHEMRTPISLVQGYVEALQDGFDQSGDTRDEIVSIIGDEMNRLERLVAELLELARLDAGQIHLELEPVAVGPVVGYMVRKLTPLVERTAVTIRVQIPGDLPGVLADGDRLEQILLNLLDNALRYSPAGSSVTVTAEADAGFITIRVRDQGPGVPAAEHQLVWERFYRGDRSRSRKKGGTGLGLAIVRGIVMAHGGQVWVEDAPGGGSAFCFTLPRAANEQPDGQS